MSLWISPFILWLAFAVTMPAMATRHQPIACWISGFICACAVFTTFIVATEHW